MSAIAAKLNFKNQIQLASRKNLSTTSSYPSSPPSKLSSPSSESPNSNSINSIHPDSHSIHSNLSNQYKYSFESRSWSNFINSTFSCHFIFLIHQLSVPHSKQPISC
ncbi:hypothetical protein O181_066075 [Austropuccinia psidii MF-1]|uniref:Uncharacterized protein n=1 Tax=Austropuccinia psidii MF-1 TaxID=1389203 RepID=A0A9Q3I4R1_9BASI|nr:hypothetical protein [Austropuccinia psidii MF-1]